jgi:hypothetical protein
VIGEDRSYELKESLSPYKGILGDENAVLRSQNEYSWGDLGLHINMMTLSDPGDGTAELFVRFT